MRKIILLTSALSTSAVVANPSAEDKPAEKGKSELSEPKEDQIQEQNPILEILKSMGIIRMTSDLEDGSACGGLACP